MYNNSLKRLMLGKIVFVLVLAILIGGCEEAVETDVDPALLDTSAPALEIADFPGPSGPPVLSVHGEVITADEIISLAAGYLKSAAEKNNYLDFAAQAKPVIGRIVGDKIADMLVYAQAKANYAGKIDEDTMSSIVDKEVQKFISRFGGNYAEARNALKEMGYDWQGFCDQQKRIVLTQSYLAEETSNERPITHTDLLDFYEKIKADEFSQEASIQFRLIDIEPSRLLSETQATAEQQRNEAMALADEILKRLKAGEEFAKLAAEYSHGHRASTGGLWKRLSPGSLAKPYDQIEIAAAKMSPGQISDAIETDGHVFIVKLEAKQADVCEPFEKVQHEVEARLIMQRRTEQFNELLGRLIGRAEFSNTESFIEFCLKRIYYSN